MVKILQVVDLLIKDSGISSFLQNYCHNNEKVHYDFLIISGDDAIIDFFEEQNSKIYFMPNLKTHAIQNRRFLIRFFESYQYDIIHSHFYQIDRMLFKIAKLESNVKCISHSHSIRYSDSRIKAIMNRQLARKIGERADFCFACSDEAGKHLFGKDIINTEKYMLINNAIDCNQYLFSEAQRDKMRRELKLKNKIVIGYVANFSKGKNHIFLLKVLKELRKINSEYFVLFIGSGINEKKVKRYILANNLEEAVLMLGKRDDVPALLCAMDIFALPSVHEGFSIACLEAEASGLPIVISNGVPDLVKMVNCVSLSVENISEWVQNIANLAEEKIDRKKSNVIINNSEFSLEKVKTKLEKTYMSIAGRE